MLLQGRYLDSECARMGESCTHHLYDIHSLSFSLTGSFQPRGDIHFVIDGLRLGSQMGLERSVDGLLQDLLLLRGPRQCQQCSQ